MTTNYYRQGFLIEPVNVPGACRQGTLINLTVEQINQILGFAPNCDDDDYKVKYSWGFKINGKHCGIWDYKGSSNFSTYGPHEVFKKLFGSNYL